jgi:hypothetical protein
MTTSYHMKNASDYVVIKIDDDENELWFEDKLLAKSVT